MIVSAQKARDPSLDVARGVAVVLMIQTHAFHGWVLPALQTEPGFRLTRWLGAFPLPAFLVLAGMGVAARVHTAVVRGGSLSQVRVEVMRRGLLVLGGGYAVNVLWGVLDGARALQTFLRADVLHAIGLSLFIVALALGGADGQVDTRRLARRLLGCAAVIAGVTPWLTRLTRDLSGPLRYLIAPLAEVRGVTLMPVFPLAAWCALGVALGLWLVTAVDRSARQRREALLGVAGLVGLFVGQHATAFIAGYLAEPLSRASVAVWPNLIEGAGRGLCLVSLGAWLARRLPERAQHGLARFGVASLLIYVAHVPFCYGRFAGPLRGALSLIEAVPWVLLLMLGSYGAVLARSRMRRWGRT